MNSPKAWSESMGSSVPSRSNRASFMRRGRPHHGLPAPSSASIWRSSGTVTGARIAPARSRPAGRAGASGAQVARSASAGGPSRRPTGRCRAGRPRGAGRRASRPRPGLQREHMAPGQPGAQVVAQRQVHRRQVPAAAICTPCRGFDEQREGGVLGVGSSSASQRSMHDQRPVRAQGPRHAHPRRRTSHPLPAPAAPCASARSRWVLPLPAGPTGRPARPAAPARAGAAARRRWRRQESCRRWGGLGADGQRDLLHRRRAHRACQCQRALRDAAWHAAHARRRSSAGASSAAGPVLQVGASRRRRHARGGPVRPAPGRGRAARPRPAATG
jgi:hypothetical protein